jgi:hypothetical protein
MHSSDDNYVKPFHPVDDFLTINVIGHLAIHGLDTAVLAQEYSTPAYIIGEQRVRENLRSGQRTDCGQEHRAFGELIIKSAS